MINLDKHFLKDHIVQTLKGGKGSGFYGHAGRIGKRGGSAPQGGSISEHRAQETSPEFKRWFEGSKVVDENGQPLVMYHGTSAQGFTEFDKSKQNPRALYGPGFYFTSDQAIASGETEGSYAISEFEDIIPGITPGYSYVGKNILSRELTDKDVKQLGRIFSSYRAADEAYSDIGIRETYKKGLEAYKSGDKDKIANWLANEGKNRTWILEKLKVQSIFGGTPQAIPVYLSIKKPFDSKNETEISDVDAEKIIGEIEKVSPFYYEKIKKTWGDFKKGVGISANNFYRHILSGYDTWNGTYGTEKTGIRILQDLGYDGIVHTGGNITGSRKHTVFIAFEPTQIKSLYNSGDFDPNNPNILKEYVIETLKGGAGSGFYGHHGRPGYRGGSAAQSGSVSAAMTPSRHKVSQKLRNTIIAKAQRDSVDNTLALIDSVHSIPANFLNIPIERTKSTKMQGGMRQTVSDSRPLGIKLNKDGCDDTASLVHEVGHYLDVNSMHNGLMGKSDNIITNELRGRILTAVARSQSYIEFKKLFNRKTRIGDSTFTVDGKYWGNSKEIFARAYMQYIGTKTGDASIAKYIARHVGKVTVTNGEAYLPMQWEAEDFKPIEKVFDEVFSEIGWR